MVFLKGANILAIVVGSLGFVVGTSSSLHGARAVGTLICNRSLN
jgi:hypothetical protein